MKKYLYLLLLVSWGCDTQKTRLLSPENFENSFTQSGLLYFKNVRQLAYDKTVHEPSKMEQFRHADRPQAADQPHITLCLVLNILTDRAYIMVEPSSFFGSDTLRVQWESTEPAAQGEFIFAGDAMPHHYRFAAQLYNALLQEHTLRTTVAGTTYMLFQEKKDREAFRVTMYDYQQVVRRK